MGQYLLSARTLVDLCLDGENSAKNWFAGHLPRDMRVSVISTAHARASIDRITSVEDRDALRSRLDDLVAKLARQSGVRALAFDEICEPHWIRLMHRSGLGNAGQTDRQVWATALAHGLTIVDRRRAEHVALESLGVTVVTLD